jgi:anion-transporting  ArsA/GET3 family ATPase
MHYDELVIDAFATGHFRALWRAPVGLAEAIPFGPMGEQSRGIVSVLNNPELTRFYVVAIPEELPVTEGLELAADIKSEMKQTPELILNRWLECPLSIQQLNRFRGHDFADYVSVLLERQGSMKKRLAARDMNLKILNWLFVDNPAEKIRQLAAQFAEVNP